MRTIERVIERAWPLGWASAIAVLLAADQSHLLLPIFLPVLLLGALVASIEHGGA